MKNTNNLLTIVIPSYNEERYIYNTLWQISRQKEINGTRVIISDANSTDKTIEYINKS
jgi:glycosyltransferase involved in cell wall biosynthesis